MSRVAWLFTLCLLSLSTMFIYKMTHLHGFNTHLDFVSQHDDVQFVHHQMNCGKFSICSVFAEFFNEFADSGFQSLSISCSKHLIRERSSLWEPGRGKLPRERRLRLYSAVLRGRWLDNRYSTVVWRIPDIHKKSAQGWIAFRIGLNTMCRTYEHVFIFSYALWGDCVASSLSECSC